MPAAGRCWSACSGCSSIACSRVLSVAAGPCVRSCSRRGSWAAGPGASGSCSARRSATQSAWAWLCRCACLAAGARRVAAPRRGALRSRGRRAAHTAGASEQARRVRLGEAVNQVRAVAGQRRRAASRMHRSGFARARAQGRAHAACRDENPSSRNAFAGANPTAGDRTSACTEPAARGPCACAGGSPRGERRADRSGARVVAGGGSLVDGACLCDAATGSS